MSNKNQKRMVRIIAIVLAVLMASSAVIAVLVSMGHFGHGHAEAAPKADNQYAFTFEYLEDEQALRVSQRLVYTNASSSDLDRVLFYAPANLYRRESAMIDLYDNFSAAFPDGYMPGGAELLSVQVDGAPAEYGFQGENESYLRVACALAPGMSCEFTFDYYLLMTENNGFIGLDKSTVRLADFYFAAAAYDEANRDFVLNPPLSFTAWQHVPAADFSAAVALPDGWQLSSGGVTALESRADGVALWSVSCESAYDFSLVFSKGMHTDSRTTTSGVSLQCTARKRSTSASILSAAEDALSCLESWFGPCPARQISLAETGYAPGQRTGSGCIWLSSDLLSDKDSLRRAVYYGLAQQYFGLSARALPVSDTWLADSVSEYLSYLIIEELDGRDAYLSALNGEVIPALQLTIPGGLYTTSDASLMTADEYEILIRDRGAVVFHELCGAMGRESFIEGLRIFYEKGQIEDILGEYDLVGAFDAASGRSWEGYLTDWLFNIGDMAGQSYIRLE